MRVAPGRRPWRGLALLVAGAFFMENLDGTIVATARIKISACAVSHGNITINVAKTMDVSQPAPLSSGGTTVVTPRTTTDVTEQTARLIPLQESTTVEKVAWIVAPG